MFENIQLLSKRYKKDSFDCGSDLLNEYLKKYALQNQERHHISVTYVISGEKNNVIAYITLSSATIKKVDLNKKCPYEELPALLIARLAVDKKFQEQGLGKKLLAFAIKKALEQSQSVGCVGIVVDAKGKAIKFYEKYQFKQIKVLYSNTIRLFLPLKTIKKGLKNK